MNMKIIKSEKRLCTCCMEEHEVMTVLVKEKSTFKQVSVEYDACYHYCDLADELYMDEQQIAENNIRLKNVYRKMMGLLTAYEINAIRSKYRISQTDLCLLLGWGAKTITRYESHQIQDKAHDTILKKLDRDPEWFLSLLNDAKGILSNDAYQKYFETGTMLYEKNQDFYLRKAVEANYAKFSKNPILQGNVPLSLDRVVDVIRYFASSPKVTSLYKVKLMKLMWYADALSYKLYNKAITGLVYQALPMGAVPVGHNSIIDLMGVPCEECDMGETNAYYFTLKEDASFPSLSEENIQVLDSVIERLGKMSKNEIVTFMHRERAYIETASRDIISFHYAESLQI